MPIDLLISEMLGAGLEPEDLKNLEKLSDKKILARFPIEKRFLKHNQRDDVVAYLNEWAAMLEEALLQQLRLPAFLTQLPETQPLVLAQ